MSGITSFFVTPADGALNFSWDVSSNLISTANINSITIVLSDAAIPGAASSAIQTRSITPTTTINSVTGVETVVKHYTWTSLTNGTRYVSAITINTMDASGTVLSYTNNSPSGLSTPGTVPIKPVFTAYPVSTGIRLKLTNTSGVASYVPRTASDGFYGIKQIKYYLSSGAGFRTITPSPVLTNSLTPDSSLDDIRDALVKYDQEFSINSLPTDTRFELGIVVTNALGDSVISDTLTITTGTAVAEIVPVAVATLEYNRYNKVSATADVENASSATVLFAQAGNTDTLIGEKFPVLGYNIYRQDVSSNGTSLIPFSKTLVGSITSLDASGNALGGQNQYNYGTRPYNLHLYDNSYNATYTFKFVDTSVVLGKYYSYSVRGFNSKGEGSEGAGSICRVASMASAPTVVAEPSNNMIKLNITNGTLNGYPMADVSSNYYYFVDVSGESISTVRKDVSGNVILTQTDGSYNFAKIVNGGLDQISVAAITINPIVSNNTTNPVQYQNQSYIGSKTVLSSRPYTNPSAPTGLALTQIENGAPISGGCLAEWTALPNSSRNGNTGTITYNVYVGGVKIADGLTLPKYRITGLTNGVSYNVTVAAVIFNTELNAQVVGVQSTGVPFTPFSLPGPATNVDLSNVSTSLTSLSALWSQPANTSLYGLGVGGLRYKYELTDMSSGEVADSGNGLTSQKGAITGLTAGTLYKLDVYSGVSFESVTYYNTTPATAYKTLFIKPAAPVNLSLYPLDGRLRCTWDPSASNGVTMTGYDIYINNGTTNGVPVYVSSTPYNIEYFIAETDGSGNALVNGTDYQVRVGAKGTVKTGLLTTADVSGNLTSSVTEMPNVGPATPIITDSIAGQGSATIKWSPIPNASGYMVFQDDNLASRKGSASDINSSLISIAPTVITFTKSGLTNGKAYKFRVVAFTTVGNLTITSPEDPPNAPVGQRSVTTIVPYAQPDSVENLDYTIGSESISLTWQAPTNAGGAGLNGNGTLKYKVKIDDKSATPITIVEQDNLTSLSFSQTGGFLNNKSYKVYVYAYYTGLNTTVYTSAAATIDTVTPNPPPQNITNLTAVAGDHSVKLSWSVPQDEYLYIRTKIAIWKSTNGGRYKLYRISDPTNTSFEDKEAAGSYRLPDNTTDAVIDNLNYNSSPSANASNSQLIALSDVVNGFSYKYKVTSLFNRSGEGAQLPIPVESATVVPNGKPIVDSVTYETFTSEYKILVTANGGKLKDWLFMGIDTTSTETPVFQGSIPLTATGTGNRDTTRQIAGNNMFEIRVPTGKSFDTQNYLFVINNDAGIEVEVKGAINDTN